MGMHTSGEIDVKSTPAAVIATIVDFSSYPEWSSAHRKAVVEETGDDGRPSRVRMTMSLVGISDEQVVDYTFDGDERVSWSLMESTQQRSQEGSYVLTPTEEGTHLVFELAVDLKIPVPGFLLNKAKKSALETATKGLKKRVESFTDTCHDVTSDVMMTSWTCLITPPASVMTFVRRPRSATSTPSAPPPPSPPPWNPPPSCC